VETKNRGSEKGKGRGERKGVEKRIGGGRERKKEEAGEKEEGRKSR